MIGSKIGIFSQATEDQLLLDLFPAAVGVSLRRLRTSAVNCIRVRRSSDNSEQDIGFAGNILDTTSLLSFVGAGDGFITTWYNQSAANPGVDYVQASASAQPQIVSSGAVILDNLNPAILFDGSNDVMTNTIISLGATVTYFHVYTSGAIATVIPIDGGSLAETQRALFPLSSGSYRINSGGTPATGGVLTLTQTLHTTSFDTLDNAFIDGSQVITNQNTGGDTTVGSTIGASAGITSHFGGNMQEVIIYDSNELSNRTDIEQNINAFYGIF